SLMGRLVPRRVEATGTLREDPASGSMGWHAMVDVTRVSWEGGEAEVRESLWLNGDGPTPTAVRGDEVSFEGVLRIPGDRGFAEALRHRGIVAEAQANPFARLGPSSNPFVRMTQVFRTFVGRSIARLFPPREAGLLMGLALGDASRLDPGLARDFQATGLGHLLVVSGENVAMVLAPMMGLALALRPSRWPRLLLSVCSVVFFVVLTFRERAVMRAGTLSAVTSRGVLSGRPK